MPPTRPLQNRSMLLRQELVANGQRGVIGPYLFMQKQKASRCWFSPSRW